MVKIRKCAWCREEKPGTSGFFAVKLHTRSGYDGVCLDCRGVKAEKPFHPAELQRMCTSKQVFNTRESAVNVAIKHALKYPGDPVQPYQCPACERWHLTTHPRKPRKPRKTREDNEK